MARDQVELLEMGLRIKELRDTHGYKQQWIADQLGVELRTYQLWQQGKTKPEQENLEGLAELFSVTPTFILRGETPEPLRGSQLDRIEEMFAKILANQERFDGLDERLNRIDAALTMLFSERMLVAGTRRDIETARRQLGGGSGPAGA